LKIPDVLATLNGFMDLIVWIMGFVNIYTTTQLSNSFFNRCVKLKFNDFDKKTQIQSRINTVKYIELGEARVPITGLHQNVIDPKHENYPNQEKFENDDDNIAFKYNINNPLRNIETMKVEKEKEDEEKKEGEFQKGNPNVKMNEPVLRVISSDDIIDNAIVNENHENNQKQREERNNDLNNNNSNKNFPSKVSTLMEKRNNDLKINFFDFYFRHFCLSCQNKNTRVKITKKTLKLFCSDITRKKSSRRLIYSTI